MTKSIDLATDRENFAAEILPHLDAAHNLARWLMRTPDAAEDVVQEAMMRALTYFSQFRGTNARGWLLQIVRNAAYAALKRPQHLRLVSINDLETGPDAKALPHQLHDPADDPEQALARSQTRHGVHNLLAQLPADLREILVLREMEDLSYREIADITGMPMGTVMSRLWRARQLMAASLPAEAKPTHMTSAEARRP